MPRTRGKPGGCGIVISGSVRFGHRNALLRDRADVFRRAFQLRRDAGDTDQAARRFLQAAEQGDIRQAKILRRLRALGGAKTAFQTLRSTAAWSGASSCRRAAVRQAFSSVASGRSWRRAGW